jgi:ketosteroid isomerase-like protein
MNQRLNVDVVQRTYEAVGRGDIPAVLELLTDDVEWTLQGPSTIPFAGTRHRRDGVAEFFTLVGQNLQFEVFKPYLFVDEGDTVVALGRERSKSPSTGRAVVQEWAHVYTLRDGKIATFQAFEDTATLAAAFDVG